MSLSLASTRPAAADSDAACPMAPLLEANRDGRLGEREAATLARHVALCESCRTFARDLDDVQSLLRGVSVPPLTPFEHQRGRLALLRAAAAPLPQLPRPRRARPLALIGVSAGAALACLAAATPMRLRPAPVAVAQHLPVDALRTVAPVLPSPRESPGPGEPAVVLAAVTSPAEPSPPEPASPAARERREHAGRAGRGFTARDARGAPSDEASRSFNNAVAALGRGDYAAARARLDAFRAAHPGDARADLASFLAIVSLQHAGRQAEAQEAARRYLALYPEGDRRAEVLLVAAGRWGARASDGSWGSAAEGARSCYRSRR